MLSSLAFLALRYISSLKQSISALENQKQNLLQELEKEKNTVKELNLRSAGLKSYLIAFKKRLSKSFLALDNAQYKLEHLNSQFSILKAENNALLEDKQRLSQENDEMKMKLSSVNELRKAIRELKLKPRIIEGNKGYLIKDGQPTVTPKVKIEVVPAQGNK